MPDSIKVLLQKRGMLRQILPPLEIDTLLSLLEPDAEPEEPQAGNLLGEIRLSPVAFKLLDQLPGLAFTGASVSVADGLVGLEPRPVEDPMHAPLTR